MRQKNFLAKKKQHRAQKRAKAQVKAFEAKDVKYDTLSILAKKFVTRKRRAATNAPAQS